MQNKKNEVLLCTHKKCKALQTFDGEYCDKHYPKNTLASKIKTLKAEIAEEIADAKEQNDVFTCCDKSFSDGYIRSLEVGLSYLLSINK